MRLVYGGLSDFVKAQLLDQTGFVRGRFPMVYLGVPLTSRRWNKVECYNLVQKITKRIKGWEHKMLSYAGRIILVDSVLQAVITYWSAIFLLPQTIIVYTITIIFKKLFF